MQHLKGERIIYKQHHYTFVKFYASCRMVSYFQIRKGVACYNNFLQYKNKMDAYEQDSHPYYLSNLTDQFQIPSFHEPKHARTGSNFTQLKSGRSNRSKFTTNNKLMRSSLFAVLNKSRDGFIRDMHKQRNFQIQLLMEMFNNLVKDGVDWVNHIGQYFEAEAAFGVEKLKELDSEE